MAKDIELVTNLRLHVQKVRNFKVKLKPRSSKVCPVCITMMAPAHIKSIMRPEVFTISTFPVLALLMRANPVLTMLWRKTNKPGYGLW